jgi:hypothetical protein
MVRDGQAFSTRTLETLCGDGDDALALLNEGAHAMVIAVIRNHQGDIDLLVRNGEPIGAWPHGLRCVVLRSQTVCFRLLGKLVEDLSTAGQMESLQVSEVLCKALDKHVRDKELQFEGIKAMQRLAGKRAGLTPGMIVDGHSETGGGSQT